MGVERAVPEEVVESVGEGAEVKVGLGVTLVEVLTEAATVRVIAAESVPVPRGDRDKEGDPESLRDTEGVALWESDSVGLTVTLRREESADRVGRAVAEPQFVTEGEGEAEGEPEEEPLAVAVSSAVPVRLPGLEVARVLRAAGLPHLALAVPLVLLELSLVPRPAGEQHHAVPVDVVSLEPALVASTGRKELRAASVEFARGACREPVCRRRPCGRS